MPREAPGFGNDLEAEIRAIKRRLDDLTRSVPGAGGGGSVNAPFTIGGKQFGGDQGLSLDGIEFAVREFEGHGNHGSIRPIFGTYSDAEAWTGLRRTGTICYIETTDSEYIWTGTAWRLHRYPVLGDASVTVTLLQQVSNLTNTVVGSFYRFDAGWVDVILNLSISSAGTLGTAISLRTSAPIAESAAQNTDIGTFRYFDSGTANYAGICMMDSAGSVIFVQDNSGGAMGGTFAAASGDSLQVRLRYPVDV